MEKLIQFIGLGLMLFSSSTMALAQEHGGNGGSGCGDVFGDLIHIKRDTATGQPILQKRWIELPQDTYGWGYCPIAIDADGDEIPFAPLSCDPGSPDAVVEVDYFGRLNGGRTKERNSRMHFNEVIASIKSAGIVKQDETGRLKLGFDCRPARNGGQVCTNWSTIDSPMENLALYTRLMKYGHLQTDPLEEDVWAHGDPALGIQYHPALGPEDWRRFDRSVWHLLPGGATDRVETCFSNGFNPACAESEALDSRDFIRAASFLVGAANKDGKITVDLVQYMNRILKIVKETETTLPNPETLPALIRDCGQDPNNQMPIDQCETKAATAYDPPLPSPADERFVDFGTTRYLRNEWREETLEILEPFSSGQWQENTGVELMDWLELVNGPAPDEIQGLAGFTSAATDGLRAIEFIHNYAIPEDLGWAP